MDINQSLYSQNSAKMRREGVIHFANEGTGKPELSGFPKITHQVDGKGGPRLPVS